MVTGVIVGSIILLILAAVVIFCVTRKNKKLDAFTKWRLHYDTETPIRRDTPAIIENDIHHFYRKNPSVNTREFTPYVSKNQRSSQRSSLRPQSMNLPMTEYNKNSTRL
jgi:hypothetical protein